MFGPSHLRDSITTDSGEIVPLLGRDVPEAYLPVHKPEGTFRVFLFGGSFALGGPYAFATERVNGNLGIAFWLQRILDARCPDKRFEVVNLAEGGVNSFGVVEAIRKAREWDPDLLIVATGNNEGFMPRTPFNRALNEWAAYRAMKKVLRPDPDPDELPEFMPQDPKTERIVEGYRANIRRCIDLAREKDVLIVFLTLPVNVKFTPEIMSSIAFQLSRGVRVKGTKNDGKDKNKPVIEVDAPYVSGMQLMHEGKYREAIERLSESRQPAYAARLIGECYENLGEYERALDYYKIYAETMPFSRTRPSFNEYLRRTCGADGIPLVDIERFVERTSPHGIPDPRLFISHCHLTWWGYHQIADEIADQLLREGVIPSGPGGPLPTPSLDELVERNRLQYLRHVM